MSSSTDEEHSCALHVEEAGELNQLVQRVASSAGAEAGAVFPRYAAIVSSRRAGWGSLPTGPVRPPPPPPACLPCGASRPLLPLPPSPCALHTQVGKYQEQPQLLDPLLEGIVAPLTALLRADAEAPAAADVERVRAVSRLLWQLAVVRWASGWNDGLAAAPPACESAAAPARPTRHRLQQPAALLSPVTCNPWSCPVQGLQDRAALLPQRRGLL